MTTTDLMIVRDWNSEAFHRRVLDLESRGYSARRETYTITAETNPETGEVIHLYSIELSRVARDQSPAA